MTIQVTAEIPQDATRDDGGLSRNIERAFRIQRKELAAARVSGRLAQDTLAVVTALLSQNQRLCAQAELDRAESGRTVSTGTKRSSENTANWVVPCKAPPTVSALQSVLSNKPVSD